MNRLEYTYNTPKGCLPQPSTNPTTAKRISMISTNAIVCAFSHPAASNPGRFNDGAMAPPGEGWDGIDDDDHDAPDASAGAESSLSDNAMVDTDEGNRMRVPGPDAYPGEAPYAAPMMGFHGEIAAVFDAFAYFPSGQALADRPRNFLPVVGLSGNDDAKNANPAWSLFGRLHQEVHARVREELGDINDGSVKPVVLVTQMRAHDMALFSISQPHRMFAPSLWLATLPISVMKVPLQTLEEPTVRALVLGERAKASIQAAEQLALKRGEQLTMGF